MKALKIFAFGLILLCVNTIQAQVSVNLNIGTPPKWGPLGYTEARYYYLPDVEAYYDINTSMFIYNQRGVWIHRSHLPRLYRNYDLYGGYKVVLTDYHGNTPFRNFSDHRIRYVKGYRGNAQKTYGERPGRGNSKEKMRMKERSYKNGKQNNGRNEGREQNNKGKKDNGNKGHGNNGKNGKRN